MTGPLFAPLFQWQDPGGYSIEHGARCHSQDVLFSLSPSLLAYSNQGEEGSQTLHGVPNHCAAGIWLFVVGLMHASLDIEMGVDGFITTKQQQQQANTWSMEMVFGLKTSACQ